MGINMERHPAEVRLDMFVMEYSLIDNVIDPCTTHLGPISRRVIDFEDAHKEVGILQIVNIKTTGWRLHHLRYCTALG